MVEDKDKGKIVCIDCGWIGFSGDLLVAAHPFDDTDKVNGCPKCWAINSTTLLCYYWYEGARR